MTHFRRIVATPFTVAPPTADEIRVHADGTVSDIWSGALDAAALIELINQEIL
jgi:hypothetical protein